MTNLKAIVGVVVLYSTLLKDSITIASLNNSLAELNKRLDLLVYDNSPKRNQSETNFEYGHLNITYIHDVANPGISQAYNKGISFSIEHGAEWILLLDQDTRFQKDFLGSFLETISGKLSSEVVCLIPLVRSLSDNGIISPLKSYPGGITKPLKNIKPGILSRKSLTGINSGTIISRNFMESIGGFSDKYPLDMLDYWYFNEIKKRNKRILLLSSVVQHDLSVDSFFDEVPVNRYNKILKSERLYFNRHIFDFCIYKLRLVFRIIKQLRARKREYAKLTLKYLYK